MVDEVLKAMEEMEARGIKLCVRLVRVALGRELLTDIGGAM